MLINWFNYIKSSKIRNLIYIRNAIMIEKISLLIRRTAIAFMKLAQYVFVILTFSNDIYLERCINWTNSSWKYTNRIENLICFFNLYIKRPSSWCFTIELRWNSHTLTFHCFIRNICHPNYLKCIRNHSPFRNWKGCCRYCLCIWFCDLKIIYSNWIL